MYLATTESPLSVRVRGGEAPICPSVLLGGEGVPELDGQNSSNSSGELGPVARVLGASGSLDLWVLDGLRVPIITSSFPLVVTPLLLDWHTALSVGCPHLEVPGLALGRPVVASTQGSVPKRAVLDGENWQAAVHPAATSALPPASLLQPTDPARIFVA